ncbi:MAG: LptF/LptG family permease [Verrucomicrobiota bacterium]
MDFQRYAIKVAKEAERFWQRLMGSRRALGLYVLGTLLVFALWFRDAWPSQGFQESGFVAIAPALWPQIAALLLALLPLKVRIARRLGSALPTTALFSTLGIMLWLPAELALNFRAATEGGLGEPPALGAYLGYLALVAFLLASPVLMVWLYSKATRQDRYLVGHLLPPVVISLLAFSSIWIVIDLSDNGPDFAQGGLGLSEVAGFYFKQLPEILVLILPISLLLGTLYSLTRMSKANELTAMIGSGRHPLRVLLPVLLAGAYASLAALAMNYQWSAWARASNDSTLNALTSREEGQTLIENHPFLNRSEHRDWFIGRFPFAFHLGEPLRHVIVRQFDAARNPVATYHATEVTWDAETNHWTLEKGRVEHFDGEAVPMRIVPFTASHERGEDRLVLREWSETPFQVASSGLLEKHLGVPQLQSYLIANRQSPDKQLAPYRTHLHRLLAEPFVTFLLCFLAAPLALVSSRRGVLGGVATAIGLFAGITILTSFFSALGQSHALPAPLAAWAANLLFGGIGGWIIYCRFANRPTWPFQKQREAKPLEPSSLPEHSPS